MASCKIEWNRSARKELEKLPRQALARVVEAVDRLAFDPFHVGTRKLVDSEKTYRVRVGEYRILYAVYHEILIIQIIRVKHRKDVYKR
jgi:mRNA interferase RelE/StbE